MNKGTYQRLVERSIYLSHTRPNIAFAVNIVSQFMHIPKQIYLRDVHRIFILPKSLTRESNYVQEKGQTDTRNIYHADYAGSIVDRRLTSEYCTFFGKNLLTLRRKKQNIVARWNAKAEFRAMAHEICELLWLKIVLDALRVKWEASMRLYCDNKVAINIAHNLVQHDRTGGRYILHK